MRYTQSKKKQQIIYKSLWEQGNKRVKTALPKSEKDTYIWGR